MAEMISGLNLLLRERDRLREALRRLHDWALAQEGDCMFSGDHPIAKAAAILGVQERECANCYGFGTGGALCDCPGVSPVCAVCGKSHFEHGSYPTCATHPYTADHSCGAVGTVVAGKFTGLPCPGPACVNGCVRATPE